MPDGSYFREEDWPSFESSLPQGFESIVGEAEDTTTITSNVFTYDRVLLSPALAKLAAPAEGKADKGGVFRFEEAFPDAVARVLADGCNSRNGFSSPFVACDGSVPVEEQLRQAARKISDHYVVDFSVTVSDSTSADPNGSALALALACVCVALALLASGVFCWRRRIRRLRKIKQNRQLGEI